MKFSIGNKTFILSPLQYLLIVNNFGDNYVCYTIFQGVNLRDSTGNLIWILGGYFLSRFYSIYDVHLNQIGLAKSISYNYLQTPPESLFSNSSHNTTLFSLLFIYFVIISIRYIF